MNRSEKHKLVRITTVPISLEFLLSGQLLYMSSYYDVIAVSSDNEQLMKIGESQNCSVFPLQLTRQITPVNDFLTVVKLYFFLKKIKPKIVHTHTPKAGVVGMLAAKLAGVPIRLHTVAGLPLLESKGIKRKVLYTIEKLTYSCATKVYPNSFGLLEIIKGNKFCPDNKLKVIANGSSNGIDTAYFNPELISNEQKQSLKLEYKINSSNFVFLFIGRLVKDKGINELVTAFERLQKEIQNISLLLLGDFEENLNPLLPSTIKSIEINNDIILVGFMNDVRPFFAIADVLTFPSYREGFPNVVLQAGAMQVPSIVSNINGCNEIIEDGVNGRIIPVKNDVALYNAMKEMIFNKNLVGDLKKNTRKKIVANYEQNVVWESILSEYRTFDS
jgi:glycosyltransferase involved in cell wall biosynthesis